jgi:hypothetical protein
MQPKYRKGQTINYKSGDHFHSYGEVINIEEKTVSGQTEVVYLVSEGNGGQRMTYVNQSDILTLLTED